MSISVDPVNDTLPVLQKYADDFGADPNRWLFCRGDLGYIKKLGLDVLKVPGISLRGHSDVAVVIGRDGAVRAIYDPGSTKQIEKLRVKLLEVLAEEDVAEDHVAQDSL